MAAGESDDLRHSLVDRPRWFVRTDTDESVEHVGDCHDSCRWRDSQSRYSQVTTAVPPLMMMEGYLFGHLQDWAGSAGEDCGTHCYVKFHLVVFGGREGARFEKDPVGNGNLANIVEWGRVFDVFDLFAG